MLRHGPQIKSPLLYLAFAIPGLDSLGCVEWTINPGPFIEVLDVCVPVERHAHSIVLTIFDIRRLGRFQRRWKAQKACAESPSGCCSCVPLLAAPLRHERFAAGRKTRESSEIEIKNLLEVLDNVVRHESMLASGSALADSTCSAAQRAISRRERMSCESVL